MLDDWYGDEKGDYKWIQNYTEAEHIDDDGKKWIRTGTEHLSIVGNTATLFKQESTKDGDQYLTFSSISIETGAEWKEGFPTIFKTENQTLVVSEENNKYTDINSSELRQNFKTAYKDKHFPNMPDEFYRRMAKPAGDDSSIVAIAGIISELASPPIPFLFLPLFNIKTHGIKDVVQRKKEESMQRKYDYYLNYNIIK
ncbi:MAG: hypothetical protein LBL13_06165 [Bacteroidales bacterium]|jgi:hypothetical protein|nr:hypothetical protein [Bacteroidales bacterium]